MAEVGTEFEEVATQAHTGFIFYRGRGTGGGLGIPRRPCRIAAYASRPTRTVGCLSARHNKAPTFWRRCRPPAEIRRGPLPLRRGTRTRIRGFQLRHVSLSHRRTHVRHHPRRRQQRDPAVAHPLTLAVLSGHDFTHGGSFRLPAFQPTSERPTFVGRSFRQNAPVDFVTVQGKRENLSGRPPGAYGSRITSLGNHRRKSDALRVISPFRFRAQPPIKRSATGRLGILSERRALT